MAKKIRWAWEYDCYVPFCPHCNEPAYYKTKCCFCGKRYQWVKGEYEDRVVIVGDYKVVQVTNNHIHIYKGKKMVYHASCTEKKTDEELREMVDHYERLVKYIDERAKAKEP